MAEKMTKREMFENILVLLNAAEADESLVKGIEHEVELLNRKRSSKSTNAKLKAEQDEIKDEIVAILAVSPEPMKATAIAKACKDDDTTVQRVSALLKQLVADGIVTREQDKKVVTFSL